MSDGTWEGISKELIAQRPESPEEKVRGGQQQWWGTGWVVQCLEDIVYEECGHPGQTPQDTEGHGKELGFCPSAVRHDGKDLIEF